MNLETEMYNIDINKDTQKKTSSSIEDMTLNNKEGMQHDMC